MATSLLTDELWKEIQPLLPPHSDQPRGGHPWADDRDCLRGIVFVLRSGIPWQMLPTEVFGVSGSTCWRRFQWWTAVGVWPEVHARLLTRLGRLGQVDLSAAVIDSASVRAVFGGRTPVPAPSTAERTAVNATC
jgi:transposase